MRSLHCIWNHFVRRILFAFSFHTITLFHVRAVNNENDAIPLREILIFLTNSPNTCQMVLQLIKLSTKRHTSKWREATMVFKQHRIEYTLKLRQIRHTKHIQRVSPSYSPFTKDALLMTTGCVMNRFLIRSLRMHNKQRYQTRTLHSDAHQI